MKYSVNIGFELASNKVLDLKRILEVIHKHNPKMLEEIEKSFSNLTRFSNISVYINESEDDSGDFDKEDTEDDY